MTNFYFVFPSKMGLVEGFTKTYRVKNLVYYEQPENAESTIHREKRLKAWKRQWKLALIEKFNPDWRDLYSSILGEFFLDPAVKQRDDGSSTTPNFKTLWV